MQTLLEEELYREELNSYLSDVQVHPGDVEEIKAKRNETAMAYHHDLKDYSNFDVFSGTVTGVTIGGWIGAVASEYNELVMLASMIAGGYSGYRIAQDLQFPRTSAGLRGLEKMIVDSAKRHEAEKNKPGKSL